MYALFLFLEELLYTGIEMFFRAILETTTQIEISKEKISIVKIVLLKENGESI
jgi:hypothetical protein